MFVAQVDYLYVSMYGRFMNHIICTCIGSVADLGLYRVGGGFTLISVRRFSFFFFFDVIHRRKDDTQQRITKVY